jgi:hypothetical protein
MIAALFGLIRGRRHLAGHNLGAPMPTLDDFRDHGGQPHLAWGRLEDLREYCFLCDVRLSAENRTGEDVLPKWLQRRFQLRGTATLRLLNATNLPYSAVLIPCCRTCNNEWLSRGENKVQAAFGAGYEAVVALDPDLLYMLDMQIRSSTVQPSVGHRA